MPQAPSPAPVIVLVDDVRMFRDGRPAIVARSSGQALLLLDELDDRRIDELWLDHDLLGTDTVQPLVDRLVALAGEGRPVDVARIWVHSSNVPAGHRITTELVTAGYPARRSFAANMWRHQW